MYLFIKLFPDLTHSYHTHTRYLTLGQEQRGINGYKVHGVSGKETGGRNQDSNIAINVSFQVNKSTQKERVLVSQIRDPGLGWGSLANFLEELKCSVRPKGYPGAEGGEEGWAGRGTPGRGAADARSKQEEVCSISGREEGSCAKEEQKVLQLGGGNILRARMQHCKPFQHLYKKESSFLLQISVNILHEYGWLVLDQRTTNTM